MYRKACFSMLLSILPAMEKKVLQIILRVVKITAFASCYRPLEALSPLHCSSFSKIIWVPAKGDRSSSILLPVLGDSSVIWLFPFGLPLCPVLVEHNTISLLQGLEREKKGLFSNGCYTSCCKNI